MGTMILRMSADNMDDFGLDGSPRKNALGPANHYDIRHNVLNVKAHNGRVGDYSSPSKCTATDSASRCGW